MVVIERKRRAQPMLRNAHVQMGGKTMSYSWGLRSTAVAENTPEGWDTKIECENCSQNKTVRIVDPLFFDF